MLKKSDIYSSIKFLIFNSLTIYSSITYSIFLNLNIVTSSLNFFPLYNISIVIKPIFTCVFIALYIHKKLLFKGIVSNLLNIIYEYSIPSFLNITAVANLSNWCFIYDSEYWEQYSGNDGYIHIIIDLKLDISDARFMLCLVESGNVYVSTNVSLNDLEEFQDNPIDDNVYLQSIGVDLKLIK